MIQTWPVTLQTRLAEINFSLVFGDTTITSDVDAGIAKKRARYTRGVDQFSGTIYLTIDQFLDFETFYKVSLNNGVNKFYYNHPITQVPSVFRFKGTPSVSSLGAGQFTSSFSWELIP